MSICSFDIDGVIFNGVGYPGLHPNVNDIIVTGRSWEEEIETRSMLRSRGIHNFVYFNPLVYKMKSRETSGEHKGKILNTVVDVKIHYEDDPIQAEIIRSMWPGHVILLCNPLMTYENRRHLEF